MYSGGEHGGAMRGSDKSICSHAVRGVTILVSEFLKEVEARN